MEPEYIKLLQRSGIFQEIPERKYSCVLECLHGVQKSYPAGTLLTDVRGEEKRAGVVLDGTVEEFLCDENGTQNTIRRIGRGAVFGAETALDETDCTAALRAATDCSVMLLDFGKLLSQETLSCPYRMQVTSNLMREFAHEMLAFNTKIKILSQKRLRDRLRIFLQTLSPEKDGCYHLRCSRSELAEFLCVDRSALSRELCRMRDEGILEFSGSRIRILEDNFLTTF